MATLPHSPEPKSPMADLMVEECRRSLDLSSVSAHHCSVPDEALHLQAHVLGSLVQSRADRTVGMSNGGVNIDKDHHQQVEHSPNDPQHGQDALLPVIRGVLGVEVADMPAGGDHVHHQ
ncbi:hypothetical protein DPEC_G00299280 [Dallia pectoralis]|uniref:Uncharacterized protein n=1 Tax=Dallia pectoralis TaxID=75939 RepID=A0ACC2FG74_DALPE|nr:hypothetical protein DPEC_G00299280 [Dallia pectoralis]